MNDSYISGNLQDRQCNYYNERKTRRVSIFVVQTCFNCILKSKQGPAIERVIVDRELCQIFSQVNYAEMIQ